MKDYAYMIIGDDKIHERIIIYFIFYKAHDVACHLSILWFRVYKS